MTTHPAASSSTARIITDRLDPKLWIILASLGIGWSAAGLSGLAWGLFGVLFAAVIPVTIIKTGTKRGNWTDRHLGVRHHRLVVMVMIIASLCLGMGTMLALNAPQAVLATIAAMLVTLVALLAITTQWKISVHTTVASGAIAMLAWTFGPAVFPAFTFVALVGWSRLALRAHTVAQVLAGSALGAVTASLVFLIAR